MAITLHRWEAADHLQNQKECDEFIRLAFESGDTTYIMRALGDVAKAQKRWGLIAAETGKNRSGLYRAFGKGGNPTMDTFFKVMTALGYTLTPTRIDHKKTTESWHFAYFW